MNESYLADPLLTDTLAVSKGRERPYVAVKGGPGVGSQFVSFSEQQQVVSSR